MGKRAAGRMPFGVHEHNIQDGEAADRTQVAIWDKNGRYKQAEDPRTVRQSKKRIVCAPLAFLRCRKNAHRMGNLPTSSVVKSEQPGRQSMGRLEERGGRSRSGFVVYLKCFPNAALNSFPRDDRILGDPDRRRVRPIPFLLRSDLDCHASESAVRCRRVRPAV